MNHRPSGHAGHGGLQRHSLGDCYPLAVVGRGDHWEVWNLLTGDRCPVRFTLAEAHAWMRMAARTPQN